MLNKYDFSFATSPEDVGMKTGATIHTMNGLNMILRKASPETPLPVTDWWEQQHLKRGLRSTGRPYTSEEDAVWQTNENTRGKDPMHRQ
jgi:hypothetical protein